MATINEIIERIDENKPNAFTTKMKVRWIAELDGKLAIEVFLMDITEARQLQYSSDDLDSEPLVSFPHDGIYDAYLEAKIDYANGEYDKYQNSMENFNAQYGDFVRWFANVYAPAQGHGRECRKPKIPTYYITAYGLAVMRGYQGTLDEWLASLKGEQGNGIKSIQQTTSSTVSGGKNVWTVTLADGTTAELTVFNGASGGIDGASIKEYSPQYYLSSSSTTCKDGEWTEEMPDWQEGYFLWMRWYIAWDNGTEGYTEAALAGAINAANLNAKAAQKLAAEAKAQAEEAESRAEKAETTANGATETITALLYNNSGAHNSLYRGECLGDALTEEQAAAIADGTFQGLYIGDYWAIDGVNYRIAAFDYFLNCGDTLCDTHHVVVVPDAALYAGVMNSTDTTDGGYVGSEMYAGGLEDAKTIVQAAFPGHVLSHRVYLNNAVTDGRPTGGAWYDSEVELMNEQMVYGGAIFMTLGSGTEYIGNFRVEKSQLPLFALNPASISIGETYWLRDAATTLQFTNTNYHGAAGMGNASDERGVRPSVCICG